MADFDAQRVGEGPSAAFCDTKRKRLLQKYKGIDMTTIAYLRCSSDKQDEASQRHIITEAMRGQPDAKLIWLADYASGGIPWQQRQLSAALAQLVQGDVIIVSEISRIARSTVGVLTFLQAAAEAQISVVAVKSGIRLDGSSASKIVVTVLSMAAEIERDMLRERTKAALQARKVRGLPIGRQPGAVNKVRKLDDRAAEIDRLLAGGVSKAAIARLCKVSRMTLHTFLENKKGAENENHV